MISIRFSARHVAAACFLLAGATLATPTHAQSSNYNFTTLDSNVAGAANLDKNLVNGWGVAFNPNGFVWVADNGTGLSTLYDGNGIPQSLVVTIPTASGTGTGTPTGIVFNGSGDFVVSKGGASGPARFIFVSEDGMISGWSPAADPTNALRGTVKAGAVYKGVALTGNGVENRLYAANFATAKIDVFNAAFGEATAPGGFSDPNLPAGYAPFNITAIQGNLYVAYAKRESGGTEEVKGAGLGVVDVFDADGFLLKRLVTGGDLNAPWGMALAPAGFGAFSNRLLVGNFGDGKINAYDVADGRFLGHLHNARGHALVIDGLWGLAFGNGIDSQPTDTLFFAAGPNDEENGLYGRIDAIGSP